MPFVSRVAAPAIEGVVQQHPGSSCSRSSEYMRESPSEAASNPGASGESSRRAVSAPRTMVARRSRGEVPNPNSPTMVSKVQVSPRWLQKTFSMSNGAPPKRSATSMTSDGATNRNRAQGSMKRRISQGQAIRSIFGRARVTHTVLPEASTGGILAKGTKGGLACRHASNPPSSTSVGMRRSRSRAATP